MASDITKAGLKDLLDKAIAASGIDWWAVLHDTDPDNDGTDVVPAKGNRLAADALQLDVGDWETEAAGSNPTLRPKANIVFAAKSGDVGKVPRRIAFWSGSNPSSATLLAWTDLYAQNRAGTAVTSNRPAAVAEADQGIIVNHDLLVLTQS